MFEHIHNFTDLRKAYREAARKAHPDMGGSTEAMQKVNADFEAATKRIERTGERFEDDTRRAAQSAAEGAESTTESRTTAADMEAFADILQKLFGLDGLEIELCGSWLWISGNTRIWKEQLKEYGCKWSKNKAAWYWYSGEYHKRSKRKFSMDEIREMHGSETIKSRKPGRLTA